MCRRPVVAALGALVAVALPIAAAPIVADGQASEDGRVAAATEAGERPAVANPVDVAHGEDVEEVLVTGERVMELGAEERRAIYRELRAWPGTIREGRLRACVPPLAQHGRAWIQGCASSVGYIYLRGLGEVTRDSTAAVGWLGVAASGNSTPEITNYFNGIWKQIPDRHLPYFEEVVEEYESKYGEEAKDVTCELRRPVDSHLKQLSCYFDKDMTGEERKLLDEFVNNKMRMPTKRLSPRRQRSGPCNERRSCSRESAGASRRIGIESFVFRFPVAGCRAVAALAEGGALGAHSGMTV